MSDGRRAVLMYALGLGVLVGALVDGWFADMIQPRRPEPPTHPGRAPAVEDRKMEVKLERQAVKPRQPPVANARREPPPSPKPAASKRSPGVATTADEVRLHAGLIERGSRWLGTAPGDFPAIVARYRPTIGFAAYARMVQGLGGRFFVRDPDAQELRAEIDLEGDRLLPVDRRQLAGLSPRSRDLSDEPELERFRRSAEQAYGPARYAVILLVPAGLDAAIIGGIEEALHARTRGVAEFATLEGQYVERQGMLVLEIQSGTTTNGGQVPLALAVNLTRAGELAGVSRCC